MARRREFVSFFNDGRGGRREFAAFDRRRRLSKYMLPALALCVLAVSVWWYAIREPRVGVDEVVTLEDVSVPAVLFPNHDGNGGPVDGSDPVFTCISEAPEWATFQATPSRTGCTTAPAISNPRILWEREVGVQGWLNNPVINDGTVYVGSAGSVQNQRDNADAIYAFELATGELKWRFGAELDVNGVAFASGLVIGTGDEGRVWGLAASTGVPIWSDDLESPTFGNPLTVGDIVVIGDNSGRVTAFDIRTGSRRWQHEMAGPIRGGASSDGELIVVNSENREVLAVDLEGTVLWRITVRGSEPRSEESRLWAAPTIVGDLVILGILREAPYIEPALIALELATGAVAWEATDSANITGEWTNVRSSPAAVAGLIVYGQTYSSHLVAVDPERGQTLWSAELTTTPDEPGVHCSQHWPSPAIVGDLVILPRQDGGVYAVSLATQSVVWSIYLGTSVAGGTFPETFGEGFCDPLPEDASAIQASPAIAPDGTIVIGTLDGRLIAIVDRDW
jgi:outer membrane protein assembly factor BamB